MTGDASSFLRAFPVQAFGETQQIRLIPSVNQLNEVRSLAYTTKGAHNHLITGHDPQLGIWRRLHSFDDNNILDAESWSVLAGLELGSAESESRLTLALASRVDGCLLLGAFVSPSAFLFMLVLL